MSENSFVDVTPSPRILRTLGEIPFAPWQCIAELVDNSIDAFLSASRNGVELVDQLVTVTWSSEAVALGQRTVEIRDNGPGMSLKQLSDAAKAGYTSNDPINSLGLFGMGFNIATARLGETTRFLSTRRGDPDWVGIEIDFDVLIKSGSFDAVVVRVPKSNPAESGTQIIVKSLKDGVFAELRDKESAIRRQLEVIYSPLLIKIPISVRVQGNTLFPKNACAWGPHRQATIKTLDNPVPAIIEIDQVLGTALFDLSRGTYLSLDADTDAKTFIRENGRFPENIVEREKRVTGWIGIQRYSDPNDFGIDFIRNGRKILIKNKDIFQFVNPLTGIWRLEYPVELGSTVGGRIIGELNVDFLRPTYQKNDFDRADLSWRELMHTLRGDGPLLPKERSSLGFSGPNLSPVGLLATAFRRMDPGTKCLVVPRDKSREFLGRFNSGDPLFISDTAWWLAAQEEDRQRASGGASTVVATDEGDQASDDADAYAPENPAANTSAAVTPTTSATITPANEADTAFRELQSNSVRIQSLSRPVVYGMTPPFDVTVWEVRGVKIMRTGSPKPSAFFREGVECHFFFDPSNQVFRQTTIMPMELLALTLAEQFKYRDNQKDLVDVYTRLIERSIPEKRLDIASLYERSAAIIERILEAMISPLTSVAPQVLDFVKESSGDSEEIVGGILDNPLLLNLFQNSNANGLEALRFAGPRTLIRIVDKYPSLLLDGHLFRAPFHQISLNDPAATARAREESKDRVLSLLKDVNTLMKHSRVGVRETTGREELIRFQYSLNSLEKELVD